MSAPQIDALAALQAAGVEEGDATDLARTLESCAGFLSRTTPPKPVWVRLLTDLARQIRPKPEEPQGLGAVVEDADGRRYVRTAVGESLPWVGAGWSARQGWSSLAAVHVLSEGVAR